MFYCLFEVVDTVGNNEGESVYGIFIKIGLFPSVPVELNMKTMVSITFYMVKNIKYLTFYTINFVIFITFYTVKTVIQRQAQDPSDKPHILHRFFEHRFAGFREFSQGKAGGACGKADPDHCLFDGHGVGLDKGRFY